MLKTCKEFVDLSQHYSRKAFKILMLMCPRYFKMFKISFIKFHDSLRVDQCAGFLQIDTPTLFRNR